MNPDQKIAWMRDKGVIQAQWSIDGELLMAVLGPERIVNVGTQETETKNDEPDIEDLLLASA